MIIVTVKSKTKAEYKDFYLKEFKDVSVEVRNEKGCLEYELYQKKCDSLDFFLFERWESREALDAHLKTKHMLDFMEKSKEWFESEKDIKFYETK